MCSKAIRLLSSMYYSRVLVPFFVLNIKIYSSSVCSREKIAFSPFSV
jgi:hypothetical protein